jgi:two-component sensor histidine kinase/uncharacterized membrane protein affecting hemolysin expression
MLIIMAVTVVVIGLGYFIGMSHYQINLKKNLIRQLGINARLIGEYCVTRLNSEDSQGAVRVLDQLQNMPSVIYGAVYDNENHIVATYQKTEQIFTPPFHFQDNNLLILRDTIHIMQAVRYEESDYGFIYIVSTMESLKYEIRKAWIFMLLIGSLLVVLSIVFASILQRFISLPILKLAQVTEHISNQGDFSLRVKKNGTDELGILYDGFNSMLEQLHLRELERNRAEEEMKASLREKEVLLKEIHHRVKNNLQIVSSLLSLQSDHIEDQQAVEMFLDCQNRVHSMALVHEKLYYAPDLASIHFADYVEALIMGLQASYRSLDHRIKFDIDMIDLNLGIDRAIPCGLLIHELVSNSLKHAFGSQSEGLIQIKLRRNEETGKLHLWVRDNGSGMPKEIDYRNTDSLGLRLAVILSEKQLKGSIELMNSPGTAFEIIF